MDKVTINFITPVKKEKKWTTMTKAKGFTVIVYEPDTVEKLRDDIYRFVEERAKELEK